MCKGNCRVAKSLKGPLCTRGAFVGEGLRLPPPFALGGAFVGEGLCRVTFLYIREAFDSETPFLNCAANPNKGIFIVTHLSAHMTE